MASVKPDHERSEVRLIALLPFFQMAELGDSVGFQRMVTVGITDMPGPSCTSGLLSKVILTGMR